MSYAQSIIKLAKYAKHHRAEFWRPQRWQRDFIRRSGEHSAFLLSSANQTGKTEIGAFAARCHLTGQYPNWWNGTCFAHPPKTWLGGVDWIQIRRVWQSRLFGKVENRQIPFTGMLPPESLIHADWHSQQRDTIRAFSVRHPHGIARVEMIPYSPAGGPRRQAQTYAGEEKVDLLIVDEQPHDEVLGQLMQRTMHGRHIKGDGKSVDSGHVLLLMTPELGATPLYESFRESGDMDRGFMNITWDDCDEAFMSGEKKERMWARIPPYQRELRSKGLPILGSGQVYPVDETELKVTPFPIPEHWRELIAMDFGFDHPFAAVKGAYDADSDTIYVTAMRRVRHQTPVQHVQLLNGLGAGRLPVVYPHDGEGHEKRSGETLIYGYYDAGLKNSIPFRNLDGSLYVEPGILEILQRMQSGRFKVFADCGEWYEEFRLYHRDQGRIVKASDDIMDATRYMAVMLPTHGVIAAAQKDRSIVQNWKGKRGRNQGAQQPRF